MLKTLLILIVSFFGMLVGAVILTAVGHLEYTRRLSEKETDDADS